MKRATELDYLRWFFQNADFGPSEADILSYMNRRFKRETGMEVPKGYEYE